MAEPFRTLVPVSTPDLPVGVRSRLIRNAVADFKYAGHRNIRVGDCSIITTPADMPGEWPADQNWLLITGTADMAVANG